MADPNQEVTPEQIEIMRAYGEALRTPQQVRHPAMGIANILGALAGHANIGQAERLRLQQIRRAFPLPTSPVPSALAPQAPASTNAPQRQSNIGHDYVNRVVQIESGGDPTARAGQNRGLGQFSPDLERRYGITDWTNPDQQRAAIAAHAQDNANVFRTRFSREPTQGELYLMHQQGVAGGPALLANPNMSAVDALVPAYNGNRVLAESAVRGNLPPNLRNRFRTITAGEFANFWTSRFDGNRGISGPTQNVASAAPTQITSRRVRTIPIDNTGMMRAGLGNELPQGPQLPPEADLSAPMPRRPGGPPAAGNLPGTSSPAAPETPPAATPASGTGSPQRPLPAGVPDRIAPNAALPLLEHQVRNITSVPPEQRQQLYQNYQAALQPIQRETAAGVSHYDPRTGQHLYTVPKLGTVPLRVPGVETQQQFIMGPQGPQILQNTPYGGANTPPNASAGAAPPVANPNITPNLPPFPQGGSIAEMSQWGTSAQAQANIAERAAQTQAGIVNAAVEKASTAPQAINTLQTILRGLEAGRAVHGPAGPWVLEAARFLSNLGWGDQTYLSRLPYQELVAKLNTQFASMAAQSMTSRPSSFDFQAFLQSQPGLTNSVLGSRVLADVLIQERKKEIEIGRIAGQLRPGQYNEYSQRVQDYYQRNPTIINIPAHTVNGRQVPARRITTLSVQTPEQARALPRGMGFYDQHSGVIRYNQ